jgi:hypothetical protein
MFGFTMIWALIIVINGETVGSRLSRTDLPLIFIRA